MQPLGGVSEADVGRMGVEAVALDPRDLANVTACSAVGFGRTMTGARVPTVFIRCKVAGGGARGPFRSTDARARWSAASSMVGPWCHHPAGR